MRLRHILHWKFLFYGLLIPLLRQGSPRLADRVLVALSSLLGRLQLRRNPEIDEAIRSANQALNAGWDTSATRRAIQANGLRYLARDGLLEGLSDQAALSRFEWAGLEAVESARSQGRGLIVVGAHFGAHLAALHALYRRGWPMRLLVQRPRHVSNYLQSQFDEDGPRSQARFFVHRGLTTGEAAERILLARGALREGKVVYLNGDIIWSGPNTCRMKLLGRDHPFLSLWADLAMLTGAPVAFLFARHSSAGRYSITLGPPLTIQAGEERQAVERFFAMLESQVAADPADAIPYLTWPSFLSPAT